MSTVLIVEDERKIARFIELELQHEGYNVRYAENGRVGLEKVMCRSSCLQRRMMFQTK